MGQKNADKETYDQKKYKMEKYQRNIFGFSFQVQILSFEYILTICLTFLFAVLTIYYVSSKIVEIQSQKLDILRSTTIVQEFDQIGKVNIIKETNLMPVIEVKIQDIDKIKHFNIFEAVKSSDSKDVWDVSYQTNVQKLFRFIDIVINVNNKINGSSKYIQKGFRECSSKDFTDRGYNIEESKVKFLLCPDIEFLQNHMFLHYGYNSRNDRQSFELLINKCSDQIYQNQCASDNEIQQLLNQLIFTVYFVQKKVNFKKAVDANPFETSLKFFQQFTITLDDYRDNNNFIVSNNVIYTKNRHLSLGLIIQKSYDIVQKPSWYSKKAQFNTMKLTTDGNNYKTVKLQVLAGMYFFLSNEVILQERQLYTYIMFFGQLGGILGLIISVLKFIVEPVKFSFDMAKIIQILYFKKNNKKIAQAYKKRLKKITQSFKKTNSSQKCVDINVIQMDVNDLQSINSQQDQLSDLVVNNSPNDKTSHVSDEGNINRIQDIQRPMTKEEDYIQDRVQSDEKMSQHDNQSFDIHNVDEFKEFQQEQQIINQQQLMQSKETHPNKFSTINSDINSKIQDMVLGLSKLKKQNELVDHRQNEVDNYTKDIQNQDLYFNIKDLKKKSDNGSKKDMKKELDDDKATNLQKKRSQAFKKMSQMKTRQYFDEQKLDYLEFTTLDILNDMILMKPFFYLFKNTRFVSNYEIYNSLKQDILEKLQIQKIMKQMTKITTLRKDVDSLRNHKKSSSELSSQIPNICFSNQISQIQKKESYF